MIWWWCQKWCSKNNKIPKSHCIEISCHGEQLFMCMQLVCSVMNDEFLQETAIPYICEQLSKNQHSLHFQLWSFNNLLNLIRKAQGLQNSSNYTFSNRFYKLLNGNNWKCKLCWFSLSRSHNIIIMADFLQT